MSKVPGDQKAILASLNNLFNFCMQAANTPGAVGSISGAAQGIVGALLRLDQIWCAHV